MNIFGGGGETDPQSTGMGGINGFMGAGSGMGGSGPNDQMINSLMGGSSSGLGMFGNSLNLLSSYAPSFSQMGGLPSNMFASNNWGMSNTPMQIPQISTDLSGSFSQAPQLITPSSTPVIPDGWQELSSNSGAQGTLGPTVVGSAGMTPDPSWIPVSGSISDPSGGTGFDATQEYIIPDMPYYSNQFSGISNTNSTGTVSAGGVPQAFF